jgi:hypothetical protein
MRVKIVQRASNPPTTHIGPVDDVLSCATALDAAEVGGAVLQHHAIRHRLVHRAQRIALEWERRPGHHGKSSKHVGPLLRSPTRLLSRIRLPVPSDRFSQLWAARTHRTNIHDAGVGTARDTNPHKGPTARSHAALFAYRPGQPGQQTWLLRKGSWARRSPAPAHAHPRQRVPYVPTALTCFGKHATASDGAHVEGRQSRITSAPTLLMWQGNEAGGRRLARRRSMTTGGCV